nr:Zinc finger HIT type [Hymenolepis microstoma]
MESDSTIPCTDEEGAKLYEIHDADTEYDTLSTATFDSVASTSRSKRRASTFKSSSSRSKQTHVSKRSRPVRQSRRPARVSGIFTDPSGSDDGVENESYSRQTPVIRTRTRAGYQNGQSSLWTLEDVMATHRGKADPESMASKDASASTLTPEQLEIRQRRIERRREAARIKAEKEMQETVERLLRVNTSFGDGGYSSSKGRGRGRGATAKIVSDSEDSNMEKKKRNSLHPSLPLDPPSGSIRFISSQRIQPHCVIAFPHEDGTTSTPLELLHRLRRAPSPPKVKLCDHCKLAPRKYGCPKTGRSLCSLQCFKAC